MSQWCLFIPDSQAGLFFYDIFWVFFTPVMVSVAKSFDAPIKVSKHVSKYTTNKINFIVS